VSSADALLHGAIAEQPASRVAVTCGDREITYGELVDAARHVAADLVSRGVVPGDRVGLCWPKSIEAIVALLGILLAGGVYVPVDEKSPPARQRTILADCAVKGVIAPDAIGEGFVITDLASGAEATLPPVDPDQAAYILYTSGSTGTPKGVVVSHRGAKRFVDWAIRTFDLVADDRLSSHAQLSFDLSVLDVFGALTVGASVHLLPSALLLRPARVTEWLIRQDITLWYSVPSALRLLAEHGELRAPALRRVLFAGEVFPVPALRRVMQALPGARFFNLFGPTETNVCLYHELPGLPEGDAIPIGRPCDHLEVELEDEEICVAGPSVMLGYFGREPVARGVFYRTGDRARIDAEGRYWFLGRRDRQIKRHGYRVELGEIETALCRLAGVREAAVVVSPDERLVAHLAGTDLGVLAVKVHCGSLLPPYMVPDAVELHRDLPRTATGKIDYGSLR
jgi:amino acid adenylation domain-containing protein